MLILIAQVVCTKIVCNLMKNNSIKGSIVNVSSIYGKVSPKQSIYDHIKTSQGSYKKANILWSIKICID